MQSLKLIFVKKIPDDGVFFLFMIFYIIMKFKSLSADITLRP